MYVWAISLHNEPLWIQIAITMDSIAKKAEATYGQCELVQLQKIN